MLRVLNNTINEQLAFVTMLGHLPRAVGERGAIAIWNARIESVLVHGRALSYFLRSKPPGKADLHYSHYSKSVWNQEAKRIDEVGGPQALAAETAHAFLAERSGADGEDDIRGQKSFVGDPLPEVSGHAEREVMGERGKETADSQFSWNVVARQMEKAYEEMIGSSNVHNT